MKKLELPRLSPSNFEIMNTVWQTGELTVTEILNAINADKKKKLKRATIQVQVNRLEERGWLVHRQEGNKFFFKATVPRQETSAEIIRDVKERIFGGSFVELVRSYFSNTKISPEEIKKLRDLIDKYKE